MKVAGEPHWGQNAAHLGFGRPLAVLDEQAARWVADALGALYSITKPKIDEVARQAGG